MKKVLLAISVIVVIAAILVSCSQGGLVDNKSAESKTEQEATTVIVDEEGTTHYYKIVSDDLQGTDSTTVLAEIATDKNGKPITNRSGEYVTTEATIVIVDNEGVTHYYKIVSDDSREANPTTVLAEIVTDKNNEPITTHSGEYVTTEYTTVITTETTTVADDNDVSFDNTDNPTTTAKTESAISEPISETETTPSESPTDSDGWINRWY